MTQSYFDTFVNRVGDRAVKENFVGLSPEQRKMLNDTYKVTIKQI